jgi:hypothetical protein
METKRICHENQQLTHEEARKVYQQLKLHPEVCDNCTIKPCVFAEYVYGKLTSKSQKDNSEVEIRG